MTEEKIFLSNLEKEVKEGVKEITNKPKHKKEQWK